MGLASAPEILARIRAAGMTIVFVNTRAQAELLFQALWRLNEETLPIAIHHGSLELEARRRVEAAMAAGTLRAVVATSSLDLGIDWGGVDQVLQVGAPKGVSRLLQRVGRANHRMDQPSRAVLVPANRFEVLECEAAILGTAARELDGDPPRPGGLDVLAQHLLGLACSAPFHPDDVYAEVTQAAPYAKLTRHDFDDVLRFVEDGGYALSAYERYRKLFRDAEGRIHVRSERVARQHRMNIGTIVEEPLLKVRYAGRAGGNLGEVEENFVNGLTQGDTFMFAGKLLRFVRLRDTFCEVADGGSGEPKVPAYAGGRMPLTTNLADRVRGMLQDSSTWGAFPEQVQEWLRLQKARSRLPGRNDLLVETFPRGDRWFLVAYCFEGRNAHQTLGMLLTRRMERAGFAAARIRRDGLRSGGVERARAVARGGVVRPRDARRRFGGVDGGKLDAAPHVPQRRRYRGADRAAPSGRAKIAAPGDGEQRPHLRRTAPASAGPHPAACHARRRRRWADGCRAHRGDAGARARPHPPHGALARVAAGGAGAAGDRGRDRALGRQRRQPARRGRATGRGSDRRSGASAVPSARAGGATHERGAHHSAAAGEFVWMRSGGGCSSTSTPSFASSCSIPRCRARSSSSASTFSRSRNGRDAEKPS